MPCYTPDDDIKTIVIDQQLARSLEKAGDKIIKYENALKEFKKYTDYINNLLCNAMRHIKLGEKLSEENEMHWLDHKKWDDERDKK